jgi:5-methylcytosine-specific restriction endonuclease McrA
MSESEAMAIRFTIDHYEPQKARPDLVDDYTNLMYACDECNLRKGDRYPPPAARATGMRFFRPDEDVHSDQFSITGILLSRPWI